MSENHYTNLGRIVLALSLHEVGDWGDCSINDPIVTLIDLQRPAHELLAALASMSKEDAAGIVAQGYGDGTDHINDNGRI